MLLWVKETDGRTESPSEKRKAEIFSLSFAWIIQLGAFACLLMSVSLSISLCVLYPAEGLHIFFPFFSFCADAWEPYKFLSQSPHLSL